VIVNQNAVELCYNVMEGSNILRRYERVLLHLGDMMLWLRVRN